MGGGEREGVRRGEGVVRGIFLTFNDARGGEVGGRAEKQSGLGLTSFFV